MFVVLHGDQLLYHHGLPRDNTVFFFCLFWQGLNLWSWTGNSRRWLLQAMLSRRRCWKQLNQPRKRWRCGLMFHTHWWLILTLLRLMTRRHLLIWSGAFPILSQLMRPPWMPATPPCSVTKTQMPAPSCRSNIKKSICLYRNINRRLRYAIYLAAAGVCVLLIGFDDCVNISVLNYLLATEFVHGGHELWKGNCYWMNENVWVATHISYSA